MTKDQIKYLKLLGYRDTQEDGAILQHDSLCWIDKFVWRDEKFDDVLSEYSYKLDVSIRHAISSSIKKITTKT